MCKLIEDLTNYCFLLEKGKNKKISKNYKKEIRRIRYRILEQVASKQVISLKELIYLLKKVQEKDPSFSIKTEPGVIDIAYKKRKYVIYYREKNMEKYMNSWFKVCIPTERQVVADLPTLLEKVPEIKESLSILVAKYLLAKYQL